MSPSEEICLESLTARLKGSLRLIESMRFDSPQGILGASTQALKIAIHDLEHVLYDMAEPPDSEPPEREVRDE